MGRSFTVLVECAGFPVDATVTEDELQGCNVDALVASGHLAELKHEGEGRGTPPTSPSPADASPAEGA